VIYKANVTDEGYSKHCLLRNNRKDVMVMRR